MKPIKYDAALERAGAIRGAWKKRLYKEIGI